MGLSIDEPLAMLRSSATHYYSADGLGSTTSLTDGSGAVAASYTYDTFGNLAASSGSVTNPFRYTAREWDAETALYFYRARYYDQALGRFLSEDPLWFESGVNFFAYAGNSPLDFVDPYGLFEVQDRIEVHRTQDWARHCPDTSAGACTRVRGPILFCTCRELECPEGSGWRATTTLRIYGDMYIYDGPFARLPRRPRDRTVVDAASAEAHERNVHLIPATDAVTPAMRQIEERDFGTQAECQGACAAASRAIPQRFRETLRATQAAEGRR